MSTKPTLRPYTHSDADACWRLFLDTVRQINSRDYTPAQVDAWANDTIDPEPWFRRFDGRIAYVVACNDDARIVGFADLAGDGYLDRLFVSSDHQRQGIATMLMNAIENAAKELSLPRIHTQASITAKPFFLARGFTVITEQTVECRGVKLNNYLMQLVLQPQNGC